MSAEKKAGDWGDAVAEQLSIVKDLQAALKDKNLTIERRRALERKLQVLSEERAILDLEHAKLSGELGEHFEDIGAAAFELYQQSPSSFDESAELLADMQQLETGIRAIEKELRQLESTATSGSFFGKTVNKGRGMVLRGRLKTRELQRVKRLKLVGEHICEFADLAALPEDSSLSRRIVSVGDTVDGFRRVRRRLKEVALDHEQLDGERVEIERSARMRNPVRNLEHQVRKLELDLAEQLYELGARYYGSNVKKTMVNEQVSKTLTAVERNDRERKRYEELLSRVEAGLAIDALEKQKGKFRGEIAGLNKKIEELEKGIAGIDKKISGKSVLLGDPATLKMPEKKRVSTQVRAKKTT